jgi:hypothetical protein
MACGWDEKTQTLADFDDPRFRHWQRRLFRWHPNPEAPEKTPGWMQTALELMPSGDGQASCVMGAIVFHTFLQFLRSSSRGVDATELKKAWEDAVSDGLAPDEVIELLPWVQARIATLAFEQEMWAAEEEAKNRLLLPPGLVAVWSKAENAWRRFDQARTELELEAKNEEKFALAASRDIMTPMARELVYKLNDIGCDLGNRILAYLESQWKAEEMRFKFAPTQPPRSVQREATLPAPGPTSLALLLRQRRTSGGQLQHIPISKTVDPDAVLPYPSLSQTHALRAGARGIADATALLAFQRTMQRALHRTLQLEKRHMPLHKWFRKMEPHVHTLKTALDSVVPIELLAMRAVRVPDVHQAYEKWRKLLKRTSEVREKLFPDGVVPPEDEDEHEDDAADPLPQVDGDGAGLQWFD